MTTGATVNLASLLMDHPFPDRADLVHSVERSVTAGAMRVRAQAVADQLAVEPGQAVAVQMANGAELLAAMIGVWLAGGVYVPVNPRLPDAERAEVLAATRPAVLITATEHRSLDDPMTYAGGVAFVMWTSGTTGWGLGAAANCMSYAPPGRKREREREPGRSASGTGGDGRDGRERGSAADGSAEQSAERRVPVWCTELGVDRAGIIEAAKRRARAGTGAMSVSVIGPSCAGWLESVCDGRRCN